MDSLFSMAPVPPEHERAQNLMRWLVGDGPVRRPMGLLDPRGVALAQAARAAGRDIPPAALYGDIELEPLTNGTWSRLGAPTRAPATGNAFAPAERMRPAHERAQNLMRWLVGDGPVRRPMGLLDPRGIALAQAARAAGRDITPEELYQDVESEPGFAARPHDGLVSAAKLNSAFRDSERFPMKRQEGQLLAAAVPARRAQSRPPATEPVDPLEYWSEYRAPQRPGGTPAGGDQIPIEIENPGAAFDTVEDAAKHIHALMNRVSVSQNTEYAWAYYRDKATGKIGYTDPIATGATGGAGISFKPISNGKPFDLNGVTPTGTGHTHGDYSRFDQMRSKVVRTLRAYDRESDDFSRPQRQRQSQGSDYEYMLSTPQDWVHTLGTPSGQTWKWTHQGGRERLR